MPPLQVAVCAFFGMVACLMAGYYLGFDWGKKQTMTKREAAKVLAKASWQTRREGPVPVRGYLPIWQRFGGDR